ncbi:MAG: TadE/TadG family type IV pilus assembly protein [Caulobacter sp.]
MGLLRRFRHDRRGVSAVEFALIAPALIAFYFGLAELTQAMMAERKASHAASAVGDLVAQSTQINDSTLSDIYSIADAIVSPFPTDSLKLRVTSIVADKNLAAKVAWSSGDGMTALSKGATVALPTGLLTTEGQSVIMSEVSYAYDSPVDFFVPQAVTFSKKFYLRPRKSDEVVKN